MPILGSIIKGALDLRSKLPVDALKTRDPYKLQLQTLKKLLRKAEITAFGETYKFSAILHNNNPIQAFQANVPLFDYNLIHKKWWSRTLNGEAFVCWPGQVQYFALSSGTSEASSKYIPVTADMLKAIQKTSTKQILSLPKYNLPPEFFEKGMLGLGGSTDLQFNGTYFEGDLSGITTGSIPFWFQHFYKPGRRISKERDWTSKLDEIVKAAPKWDIGVICGVPAWLQVLMERIISEYNLQTIHDIWPNLAVYVHGGVSFTPYQKRFEKLFAKPLVYMETYLASEGFIAYQSRPNADGMELVLDNGIFFEFVPFNNENFDENNNLKPTANVLTINQVETGKDYALLLSTCAGAWRYLIGDTIRFTSTKRNEIVITGRTKHFMSMCGEHLSQENMNKAIELMAEQLGVSIPEFSVAGIPLDSMFAHRWYLGTDDTIDAEAAKRKIDENLKLLNDDYRVERLHAIREIQIEVFPVNVFYDWMRQQGKEGAQNKFPRVLKGTKLDSWQSYLDSIKK